MNVVMIYFYSKRFRFAPLFNYFKIPWWPSELLLPSAKNPAHKGWIGLAGQQVSLKATIEFQNIFLSQKWCQISIRIFCVLSGTKNLEWTATWLPHIRVSCHFQILHAISEIWALTSRKPLGRQVISYPWDGMYDLIMTPIFTIKFISKMLIWQYITSLEPTFLVNGLNSLYQIQCGVH